MDRGGGLYPHKGCRGGGGCGASFHASPGTRDPDGVPGLVEPLDRSVVPVRVDGSFVLHEHSGVGSVW
eukprot:6164100-Amphidinium_carterae.1